MVKVIEIPTGKYLKMVGHQHDLSFAWRIDKREMEGMHGNEMITVEFMNHNVWYLKTFHLKQ